MPRLAIDYSKTVIYKLVHEDDYDNSNVYVGHTTDFIKRKNGHKTSCNNPNTKLYNTKVYKNIRDNGGWDAWKMVEIEKYPCKDEREASARERYYIELIKSNLNTKLPTRTMEEWRENNKEFISKCGKIYYQNNKEIKKLYQQKQVMCECGCEIQKGNILKHQKTLKHSNMIRDNTSATDLVPTDA
jgi:hypothetical protein